MQTLFRNALAEPYVLGVTSGAGLGVGLLLLPQGATTGVGASLLAGLAPLHGLGVVGAAALGAFAVLLVMLAIAGRVRNMVIVLLAGIMVGAFLGAVTNVLVFFARPEAVVAFTQWQFGSFEGVPAAQLPVRAAAVTACTGPIAFLGIAAPHLARGLLGTADHRLLIPGSALLTALVAGIFAQLPGTGLTLPLNAALALLGAPVVLHVLLRINRAGGDFHV
ncbi:iron chelate uptake ABC transporter family permease subunit [Nonomuraea fuscirosea]|uniref:iron chelate uptake ABC transporter family permease subunit n=1 Tax=Nonomuraea fuscirosea TaxID=1291556 RepID=UPI003448A304